MFRAHLKLATLLAVVVLALSSAVALAGGAMATTTVTKDVVFVAASTDSCHNDAPVTFMSHEHDVFHITTLADGTLHIHIDANGTFTFTPDDPSIPATAGHFSAPIQFNGNRQSAEFTAVQTLSARVGANPSDHRVFHETVHYTVSATGVVTTDFDMIQVQCP
jgi:hypothetical protein